MRTPKENVSTRRVLPQFALNWRACGRSTRLPNCGWKKKYSEAVWRAVRKSAGAKESEMIYQQKLLNSTALLYAPLTGWCERFMRSTVRSAHRLASLTPPLARLRRLPWQANTLSGLSPVGSNAKKKSLKMPNCSAKKSLRQFWLEIAEL